MSFSTIPHTLLFPILPRPTYAPHANPRTKVDFHQEDGTLIKNIISNGPSMDDGDLHMTYCFEFDWPHIEEGSAEAEKEVEKMTGVSLTHFLA